MGESEQNESNLRFIKFGSILSLNGITDLYFGYLYDRYIVRINYLKRYLYKNKK